MKKLFLVLSAFVLIAFGSCKKMAGELISKDFSIENTYTDLSVHDAFDVTVCDTVSQVTVTIGENLMPKVVVEVVNNTLKIYLKPFYNITMGEAKVVIPYNANLKEVGMSGASSFHSDFPLVGDRVNVILTGASNFYGSIDANDVDINLSGASKFYGDVWADEIDMELSGGSDIQGNVLAVDLDLDMTGASNANLIGAVSKLKVDLSGASNIVKQVVENRYGLACDDCEGEMSGACKAYIHCDGTIKVDLSGASDLHFTGEGNPADSSTSGGSNIIHDVNP